MRRLLVILALFCVGFVKLSQPCWEDLQFPLNGVNPAGPATSPTLDTTDGLWSFSGTSDNVAVFWMQMPHGWQKNTLLDPHIHWRNETTGVASAVFRIEWRWAGAFQDFSGGWVSSSTIVVDTTNSTATHRISEFADFTPADLGHSGILQIQLSRLAASDARDNHTGGLKALSFDIHYLRESMGSFLQYGD